MKGINLLPWRETFKEEQKKQFMILLVGTVIFGGLFLLFFHIYIIKRINHEKSINHFIKKETAALDKRIAEIHLLKERRRSLLEHIKLIHTLQTSRTLTVNVYDSIVKMVPHGVYLLSMKRENNRIVVIGKAQSNTCISELMRNIEQSQWLTNPVLTEIKTNENNKNYRNDFILVSQQRIQ